MAIAHPARHLLRTKDLMDARYREPLDVATLARAARLSPWHFSREFRRAFGSSPHRYLLERRLERAASLLRTTDRSKLTSAQVWVRDQDEALAFYTEKLGLELREDVTVPELGNFRWLTVGVPGQPDVGIAPLTIPARPSSTPRRKRRCRPWSPRGAATGLFFSADDVRATYEELRSRGVEFQHEPTEQPYGIDVGLRDPSGNQMRIGQLR